LIRLEDDADPDRVHHLKSWPGYYWAVYGQAKTFEIRKNDRDFRVGHVLELQEWDPIREIYTGQQLRAEITYMISDLVPGIEEGYCALGISLFDD